MSRLPRQAVLLVHGIGEQVPLATLRGFVRPKAESDEAVVESGDALYFSTDIIGGHSYSRRLRATWNQQPAHASTEASDTGDDHVSETAASAAVPPADVQDLLASIGVEDRQQNTDFYEFYWVPRFRDTRVSDLSKWAGRLLVRRRSGLYTTRPRGAPREREAASAVPQCHVLGGVVRVDGSCRDRCMGGAPASGVRTRCQLGCVDRSRVARWLRGLGARNSVRCAVEGQARVHRRRTVGRSSCRGSPGRRREADVRLGPRRRYRVVAPARCGCDGRPRVGRAGGESPRSDLIAPLGGGVRTTVDRVVGCDRGRRAH